MTDNRQLTTGDFQWAIGLMSGTSLDGIDAALIKTDGREVKESGPWLTLPFDENFHESMAQITQQVGDIALIEQQFTERCVDAVKQLLTMADMRAEAISVIGFHGQTIDHRPDKGITWQIGNGALMAAATGIDTITDFRRRDMADGGQGAPLVPLYHAALARELPKPLAVVNIGGMANVTWIDDEANNPWILAFDTGPGNGLMNRLMQRINGETYDKNGVLAAQGTVNLQALEGYFYDVYFAMPPPKSLDRHDFGLEPVLHLSDADGMATLLEFTAQSIARSAQFFPNPPKQWLIAGGGVHNPVLMERLKALIEGDPPLNLPPEGGETACSAERGVLCVDDIGWASDALEAQAFAFLAVRSLAGLPLTLPQLTGVRHPVSGGALYRA